MSPDNLVKKLEDAGACSTSAGVIIVDCPKMVSSYIAALGRIEQLEAIVANAVAAEGERPVSASKSDTELDAALSAFHDALLQWLDQGGEARGADFAPLLRLWGEIVNLRAGLPRDWRPTPSEERLQ